MHPGLVFLFANYILSASVACRTSFDHHKSALLISLHIFSSLRYPLFVIWIPLAPREQCSISRAQQHRLDGVGGTLRVTISRPNLGRVWKGAHGVHGKLAQHPGANMYSRVGWGSSERPWMEERIEAETSVSLKITTPLWCICDGDWL